MSRHSLGLVLIDGGYQPENLEQNFQVTTDGETVELHGWGRFRPNVPEIAPNPPAGPNVHLVYVSDPDAGPQVLRACRGLIDEHLARYKEVRVWAWPASSSLERWISGGCVAPPGPFTDDEQNPDRPSFDDPTSTDLSDVEDELLLAE